MLLVWMSWKLLALLLMRRIGRMVTETHVLDLEVVVIVTLLRLLRYLVGYSGRHEGLIAQRKCNVLDKKSKLPPFIASSDWPSIFLARALR